MSDVLTPPLDTTNERERLSEAGLQGCYLKTLLRVIEDTFEEIDRYCEAVPEDYRDHLRSTARHGLNVTYMAQEKAGSVKRLANDVEEELWRAERKHRGGIQ